MENRICVLSSTTIHSSRERRSITTMAKHADVDFYFLNSADDSTINLPDNITLFPYKKDDTGIGHFIKHGAFYKSSTFLAKIVSEQQKKYDVIYSHDLTTTYPAYLLAKEQNIPIIYDVHDLGIETINQQFPKNGSFLKQIGYKLAETSMKYFGRKWEAKFIQSADLTVTVNKYCKQYLERSYQISNCVITPNYPSLSGHNTSTTLHEKLNIEADIKLVVYHGVFNQGRSLTQIAACIKHLNDDIEMVFIGGGSLENEMKRIINEDKMNHKTHFLPLLPNPELIEATRDAALGLVLNEHINLSKEYALANKITEYMAAGIPVLASESKEHYRVLEDAKCGIVQNFGSAAELGEKINKIINGSELMEMSKNGEAAFKSTYNWENYEQDFEELFLKVLNPKRD